VEEGPVLRITFDRPDRGNALTGPMVDEVIERIETAGAGDTARVIVVRGEGRHFCSGMDIAPGGAGERDRPRAGHLERLLARGAHRLIEVIGDVQLPVVTVVRGYAAGIGLSIALSGDYVIADSTATFWAPFVGRGFTPDSGTTWLLPKLVGMARAKDMLLRSRPVDAEEARRWGLLSDVVAPDELDRVAASIVDEFARAATVSVGLAKSLLSQNAGVSLSEALRNEAVTEELAIRTGDFREGMKAFAARRPPDFTGR
jgi:2-(1,2-epoxy-1,2-dihydrophenyl)acetyl-CoA isomerase